ncbi:hypothetical protein FM104_09270 [Microbacterium esteraromaticum]|uniref:Uncharacterized protein n=1 Tax=Microbacterium esteraromaticum TaxID=57043 RepID=A0A1R4JXF5_9MICO|nr:HAD domain-containing protein [Microbacterium esteraromaticum]SJN36515.1 hypothetical protein FM104_09270 [Microbacterium esteraromaticum]
MLQASDAAQEALIVLDVDGTIARIYHEHEQKAHRTAPGWHSWMSVSDEVIDALEALTRRPGVQIAWLTTWPHDQVKWLIQGPLRGKLDGAYVPWQNWPHEGWRMQSLISYVRRANTGAVAWADDRAPGDAASRLTRMTEVPSFLVVPDKFVGLTIADIDGIQHFLDEHLEHRS